MNPLVSIAIPTCDRLNYLREAVASALSQTYDNIEILIGDDGSTQSIQAWGRTIVSREPRVRYRRNAHTLGLAGNWNALANAAQGEFLVIIGDDDRLLPDFVITLVDAIQPYAHVAFSNHYLIDSRGHRLKAKSLQHTQLYRRDVLPAGEVTNVEKVVWRNSVPMSASLIRTRDVQRLRFKEDLNTPEIELFIRLAQEGARFVFVPEYLSEYRTHPLSATAAGLYSERLAKCFLAIPVSPDVEIYKREFMVPLLVNAVSRCLQQKDWQTARTFLRSEYYPRPRWKYLGPRAKYPGTKGHIWLQALCASLPAPIGYAIYRLAYSIKSSLGL